MDKKAPVIENADGFTLVEVLMAVVIVAVGLLVIGLMQIKSVQANAFAMELTEAATTSLDHLEYLMSLDYTDADLNSGTHSGTADNGTYTLKWDVTQYKVSGGDGRYKRIDLTVSWTDGGRSHSMSNMAVKIDLDA